MKTKKYSRLFVLENLNISYNCFYKFCLNNGFENNSEYEYSYLEFMRDNIMYGTQLQQQKMFNKFNDLLKGLQNGNY